jgi:hypothetical protein
MIHETGTDDPIDFPPIDEVIKETPQLQTPPKMFCEKHGELNDAYAFRVNMPEFGYENKTYCLVCAIEYLSMVASEVTFEQETK